MNKKILKIAGFTLAEMAIVIAIIGIFVAVAIPQYNILVERIRAQEQVAMLLSIYVVQQDYATDNPAGCGPTGTDFCYGIGPFWVNYMDVSTAGLSTFYSLEGWTQSQGGCGMRVGDHHCPTSNSLQHTAACDDGDNILYGYLATARRNTGPYDYSLYVLENGRVVCKEIPISSCQGICKKLGFPVW